MDNYTGYLKPYVPLIAAMLLAGQKPAQIARLLEAMGASWNWSPPPPDEPLENPNPMRLLMGRVWDNQRRREYLEWKTRSEERVLQMTSLVSYLARKWPIAAKRRPYVAPVNRKITAEWTPESNWHEAQAIRAEG